MVRRETEAVALSPGERRDEPGEGASFPVPFSPEDIRRRAVPAYGIAPRRKRDYI